MRLFGSGFKNEGPKMWFHKQNWWFLAFIIIIWVCSTFYLSAVVKDNISRGRQELARIREAQEQATISQVSICTKDGRSLSKQEGSSMYIIPVDMERIFICGSLEISDPDLITIHLFKNGEAAFTSTSAVLEKGPFIMDVISTDPLSASVYRADIHIVREKPAASVSFVVVKVKK